MKKLLTLLAALALSGCSLAPPLVANDKVVVYNHGTARFNEALMAAQEHCAKYGKIATMSAQTCPATCTSQFRCE